MELAGEARRVMRWPAMPGSKVHAPDRAQGTV
jgi:hypothetical protein